MTMQECYEAIGGNYEAVLGRLHSEALIRRFALKFLEDQSYIQLKQALENKNYEDAFRGAHTLKGVCQNLSFDRLYEVSHELTELLRDRTGEPAARRSHFLLIINTQIIQRSTAELRPCTARLLPTRKIKWSASMPDMEQTVAEASRPSVIRMEVRK
mgnify:CR=1 FL=1